MSPLIVTRHPALISLLIERGLATAETPVIAHATVEAVKGNDIIGVLPLSLAVHARTVTEVPLALTPELRGKELDLPTLRQIAGEAVTYKVSKEAKQ